MVADCYFGNSIKAAEATERDTATKIIIKPPKLKVPRDFWNFLSDGENKKRMIALLFETIKEKKSLTERSENTTDDLLHEQECTSLMLIGYSPYSQMLSTYKEANIKFIPVRMEAMRVKLLL